jgi:tyrosyl-tRNA synthetase
MKSINEKRYELITRNLVEIIEPNELMEILEEKQNPVVYHGFEPSSKALHIGYLVGIQKHMDFIDAKLKLIILLANLHAWLNEKGDWQDIEEMANNYKKNFLACGLSKAKFVLGSDFQLKKEYWLDVMKLALKVRLQRARRSMTLIGRKDPDPHIAQLIYPLMQVVDMKHLAVDIAFGDLAQRKVHMIAREYLKEVNYKPPICLHHIDMHPLKFGLEKMSSSKPESTIFINEPDEVIRKKIMEAYCAKGVIEANPIMEILEYIVFGRIGVKELKVEREKKYGGDVTYRSYQEVKNDFMKEKLHPLDLKRAVAEALIKILKPIKKRLGNE